jgi:hypothetical protein
VRFDQGANGLAGWISCVTGEGEPAFQEDIEEALRHNMEV